MRLNKILSVLPIAAVIILTAAPADAQGSFSFGFSRFGRCSGFGLGFTVPIHNRCWVPAHYETVVTQVWVEGCARRVYVEPVYNSCVDPCGNVTRVIVREGYYQVVQDPGHYETRYMQIWVQGYYQ
jgi:hypothetical protein